jgi:hypothetical protein
MPEPYREEGSTFGSNGRVYDLNRIFEATQGRRPRRVRMSELDWILRAAPPHDAARVARADTRYPILVHREGGRTVVVDGLHRLAKLKAEGAQTVRCVVVPDGVMDHALVRK